MILIVQTRIIPLLLLKFMLFVTDYKRKM